MRARKRRGGLTMKKLGDVGGGETVKGEEMEIRKG